MKLRAPTVRLIPLLVLLSAGTSCGVPAALGLTPASGTSTENEASGPGGTGAPSENDGTPPPPEPLETTESAWSFEASSSPGGLEICAEERRDLPSVHISLSTSSVDGPEMRILFKHWILQALSADQAKVQLGDRCESVLCLRATPGDSNDVLAQLRSVLRAPPHPYFYAAKREAARELSALAHDPEYFLTTQADAVHRGSPYLDALRKNPKSTDILWEKALRQLSGERRLQGITLTEARERFTDALRSSRLVIAGPTRAATATTGWRKIATDTPGRRKAQPLSNQPGGALRVRLSSENDWTRGIMSWPYQRGEKLETLLVRLELLVLRILKDSPRGLAIRVRPPGHLYANPAIFLQGPFDETDKAVTRLLAEAERLAAKADEATEGELAAARSSLDSSRAPRFAPRCAAHASSRKKSEKGLSSSPTLAGDPVVLLWGTNAPSEDSADPGP